MHLKDNKMTRFKNKLQNVIAHHQITSTKRKKKHTNFINMVGLITLVCSICCVVWMVFAVQSSRICKYLLNKWIHVFDVRWSVNIFYLHTFSIQVYAWNSDSFLFIYSTHHLHETHRRECTIRRTVRFLLILK